MNYTELGRFASLDPVVAQSHIVNGVPDALREIIKENEWLLSLDNDNQSLKDELIEAAEILNIYSKVAI